MGSKAIQSLAVLCTRRTFLDYRSAIRLGPNACGYSVGSVCSGQHSAVAPQGSHHEHSIPSMQSNRTTHKNCSSCSQLILGSSRSRLSAPIVNNRPLDSLGISPMTRNLPGTYFYLGQRAHTVCSRLSLSRNVRTFSTSSSCRQHQLNKKKVPDHRDEDKATASTEREEQLDEPTSGFVRGWLNNMLTEKDYHSKPDLGLILIIVVLRTSRQDILTIPNLLTSSRMLMSPVLGYLVLQENFYVACGLFVFAGITDLLDGWIARRFPSQQSAFGSFLDPLADKFLIGILFVTLTMVNLIPVPLAFVIVARDVLLVTAGFYVRYISMPKPVTLQKFFDGTYVTAQLQPMLISKINTALQLSLVALTLAAPVFGYVDHLAMQALWYTTGATTVVSGLGYGFYAKDTYTVLSKRKKKTP